MQNVTPALPIPVEDIPVARNSDFGGEARVDWYEAHANFSGDTKTVCRFCMHNLANGAAFHCAYLQATQQGLLEGHQLAFAWFGGVFARIRYGNRKASVKKVCGIRRKETERFIAFCSHWGFEAYFGDPVEGHDNGAGEGESVYFRRNDPAAVPRIRDLADLNRQLRTACQQDERHRIGNRTDLRALPRQPFDLAEISFPSVDRGGCVRVMTNRYSTPLKPGMQAEVRAHASYVEIWHNGQLVARHERCYEHQRWISNVEGHLKPPKTPCVDWVKGSGGMSRSQPPLIGSSGIYN